jgi:hypothetical protein
VLVSDVPVPAGGSTVGLRFRRAGADGDFTMLIDGRPAGTCHVPLAMRIMSSIGHSIGLDCGSAVSPRYAGPNPFQGVLHTLVIQVDPPDAADEAAAATVGMSHQ